VAVAHERDHLRSAIISIRPIWRRLRRPGRVDESWDASGRDRMRGRAATVDEAHTMTITLQASPHDQLEESLATAGGRFGRQIGTIAWPDPEQAPVRSAAVLGMRARVQYRDYQIDSFVLAEAIIDRLCAGGLTTRLQEQAV
jgi:hypothetical protein